MTGEDTLLRECLYKVSNYCDGAACPVMGRMTPYAVFAWQSWGGCRRHAGQAQVLKADAVQNLEDHPKLGSIKQKEPSANLFNFVLTVY